MVENTNNKEHIKKLMATSKAKRPDIWSDYGNSSLWSFSSRSHKNKNNQNASFSSYQYVKLFKPAVDLSLESLSLVNDNKSCPIDNVLNNNLIIARNDNNLKIQNQYNSVRKEITVEVNIQNKAINDALNKEYLDSNQEKLKSDNVINYGNDNQRCHFINNDSTGTNIPPYVNHIGSNNQDEDTTENIQKTHQDIIKSLKSDQFGKNAFSKEKQYLKEENIGGSLNEIRFSSPKAPKHIIKEADDSGDSGDSGEEVSVQSY